MPVKLRESFETGMFICMVMHGNFRRDAANLSYVEPQFADLASKFADVASEFAELGRTYRRWIRASFAVRRIPKTVTESCCPVLILQIMALPFLKYVTVLRFFVVGFTIWANFVCEISIWSRGHGGIIAKLDQHTWSLTAVHSPQLRTHSPPPGLTCTAWILIGFATSSVWMSKPAYGIHF